MIPDTVLNFRLFRFSSVFNLQIWGKTFDAPSFCFDTKVIAMGKSTIYACWSAWRCFKLEWNFNIQVMNLYKLHRVVFGLPTHFFCLSFVILKLFCISYLLHSCNVMFPFSFVQFCLFTTDCIFNSCLQSRYPAI